MARNLLEFPSSLSVDLRSARCRRTSRRLFMPPALGQEDTVEIDMPGQRQGWLHLQYLFKIPGRPATMGHLAGVPAPASADGAKGCYCRGWSIIASSWRPPLFVSPSVACHSRRAETPRFIASALRLCRSQPINCPKGGSFVPPPNLMLSFCSLPGTTSGEIVPAVALTMRLDSRLASQQTLFWAKFVDMSNF